MRRPMMSRVFFAILVFACIASLAGGLTACTESREPTKVVGFPQSFADLSKQVTPAVVNISTTTTVRIPGNLFQQFFGPYYGDIPDRELKQRSLGSGFIVEKDGYIITNNHVVDGASEIKVKLADGRESTARVIGRDPKTDLALIKISTLFSDLPTLTLGDSNAIQVGDWVLAVGNPFGLEHTVTQGIISASGRVIGSGPYDNFLQTDAPINPGNSGGPLVNMKGEVVGINSAIVAAGQGIGFAIPSSTAKMIVAQLREKGKVVRGWIGVSIQTVTPGIATALGLKEARGVLVSETMPGGPAEQGGLQKGDVIVSFDGKKVNEPKDLSWIVADTPVGKEVDVKVIRDGKEMDLKLKIAEMTGQPEVSQAPGPGVGLGLTVDNLRPELRDKYRIKARSGVVILRVAPGSPSDIAGLQAGDVILEINRQPVADLRQYGQIMAKTEQGKPVLLLLQRAGQTFFVAIALS
jgi:serine protease Do